MLVVDATRMRVLLATRMRVLLVTRMRVPLVTLMIDVDATLTHDVITIYDSHYYSQIQKFGLTLFLHFIKPDSKGTGV